VHLSTMNPLLDLDLDMFTFFEMTPDFVCIAGKDGYFRKVNPAVINKLGYTQEELFSRLISSFIHPDDQPSTKLTREEMLNGKALLNFQNRYITKQGKVIWLEWTSIYFADKEIVFALAKDISERKQIDLEIEEKYKEYKSLATHFKSSIEEDKKYLAVELHEELAQLMAVVKLDIDWIIANEPGLKPSSKVRMNHALAVSDLVINTIRRISFSISPKMLEDHGLDDTLRWHCKEFQILTGIPCTFKASYNETDLSYEMKLDFFRICQEALSNVMYHAEANNVNITIEDPGDEICLCITDDGKGFDVAQQEQTPGLTSMRQRAASINGRLTIGTATGKGTSVLVAIKKPGPNIEQTTVII
jgi:PAS domain S-box-containing protein